MLAILANQKCLECRRTQKERRHMLAGPEYDNRILDAVERECKVSSISRIPAMVEWRKVTATGSWSYTVRSDDIILDWKPQVGRVLVLSSRMKGKLEPEEWAALVLPALIMNARFPRMIVRHLLLRWFLPGLLALSLILMVLYGIGDTGGVGLQQLPLIPTTVALLVGLFLAVYFFSAPYMKSVCLITDQQASQFIGRERIVHTLERLYAVADDQDFLSCKGFRGWFRHRPGIPQRIESLNSSQAW